MRSFRRLRSALAGRWQRLRGTPPREPPSREEVIERIAGLFDDATSRLMTPNGASDQDAWGIVERLTDELIAMGAVSERPAPEAMTRIVLAIEEPHFSFVRRLQEGHSLKEIANEFDVNEEYLKRSLIQSYALVQQHCSYLETLTLEFAKDTDRTGLEVPQARGKG